MNWYKIGFELGIGLYGVKILFAIIVRLLELAYWNLEEWITIKEHDERQANRD